MYIPNINNRIDEMFSNFVKFIKERTYEQIYECIKNNYTYRSKTDSKNYKAITDFYNKHKLWGKINVLEEEYELIENNAKTLFNDIDRIVEVYNKLEDYRSKNILTTIMYYWLLLDYKKVDKIMDSTYVQYFDLDIVKCDNNEVFVDIGGYIGDTLISYVSSYGENMYKDMYIYEMVPKNIENIQKNVEKFGLKNVNIREKAVGSINSKMYIDEDEISSIIQVKEKGEYEIDVVKIDDDIDGRVSFIKMDIEGAEEDALLGCREKIKKYHPKLAISVYHNNSHIFKIFEIIKSIDPTYKFYLRYYGGRLLPTEYILYAI